VSAAVVFVTAWETRVRLRRLEVALAEWEERLVKEVKTRAARASVEARQGRLNPLDEALIRQHTQHPREIVDDSPWWEQLVSSGGKPNREQ
jgi:hypothetical protein